MSRVPVWTKARGPGRRGWASAGTPAANGRPPIRRPGRRSRRRTGRRRVCRGAACGSGPPPGMRRRAARSTATTLIMLAVSAPVLASPSTVAPSMPARLSVRGFSETLSVYVDLVRPSALVAVMVALSWSLWMVTPMPVDVVEVGGHGPVVDVVDLRRVLVLRRVEPSMALAVHDDGRDGGLVRRAGEVGDGERGRGVGEGHAVGGEDVERVLPGHAPEPSIRRPARSGPAWRRRRTCRLRGWCSPCPSRRGIRRPGGSRGSRAWCRRGLRRASARRCPWRLRV